MAAQADLVIEGSILHSRFVRIVARCAGESSLTISPTAALLQTGGRKPKHENPAYGIEADISRRAVTSTTEIYRVGRAEASRIENQGRSLRIMFQAHLRDMLRSRAMTCFTGNSRNHLFGTKYAVRA
jgi:hypothetical protein